MATFDWVAYPEHGGCLSCLSQVNDRGFVKTHTETKLMRNEYEISGYADVIFCGDCLLQMSRLVGASSPQETEEFAQREYDLSEENEKLKDEVVSWRQRFERVFDLKVEAETTEGQ